jgi:hypothetical protein
MKMGILPRMGGEMAISETKKPGSLSPFLESENWPHQTCLASRMQSRYLGGDQETGLEGGKDVGKEGGWGNGGSGKLHLLVWIY